MSYGRNAKAVKDVNSMSDFRIFTDATADLTDKLKKGLPEIITIPMHLTVGGEDYTYGSIDGIHPTEVYQMQRDGKFATTSQITPVMYFEHFEPYLKEGIDIIYFCFSSGMSGTYQSAMIASMELKEKYPERKIICVDTLGAACGEGFLVREAAKMQAKGLTIEELEEWSIRNRSKVCHWFTVDTFTHLKHGGRVSAATAAMGTMLSIKPLLHVDENGKLEAIEKIRGRKKALSALLARLEEGWLPELGETVIISHADDKESAELLKDKIKEKFSNAEVLISDLGPIIGAHTGPNAITLFYWGSNR